MRRTTEPRRLILLALLAAGLVATQTRAAAVDALEPGQEVRVKGFITSVGPGAFSLRDRWGNDFRVVHISETVFEEQKSNFFRWPHAYSPKDLLVGLEVNVKGEADQSGNLIAESVKFTQNALRIARSLQTRVTPLEGGLESNARQVAGLKRRLDENQAELGAQVGDLKAGIQSARKESGEALQLAGRAMDTGRDAHTRLGDIDDYEELGVLTVPFDFDSSVLGEESARALDDLVVDLGTEDGFLLEISGFASSDGDDSYNQRLSQSRAQEVIRYLVLEHGFPRHRILAPFGFGENQPIADNEQLDGRQQNRRVEVRILINMGVQSSRNPAG